MEGAFIEVNMKPLRVRGALKCGMHFPLSLEQNYNQALLPCEFGQYKPLLCKMPPVLYAGW